MKFPVLLISISILTAVLLAGCTTQPPAPVTVTPTPSPVPTMSMPPSPVSDPALTGTWTIRTIGLQGGSAPLNIMNAQITAIFDPSGHVSGNGGCNSYGATYTLTGKETPFGKGISVGPVVSTLMYCEGKSDIEGYYLGILQNATSYAVDGNTTLSIRDSLGSVLVYNRG